MNPLQLSPLPTSRSDDDSGSLLMEREGFVDEAVVAALVTRPLHASRTMAYPEDLVLAADEMDFAGWSTFSGPLQRGPEVPPQVIEAIVRRAAPPQTEEPGLGQPHAGSPRWWLAGLAGILSTMLFSVLLMTLSERSGSQIETILSPKGLVSAKPAPTKDATADSSTEKARELTDISTGRH